MVNVPGRSKGCNTCRRRKKGCDLRKPACARCERDGIHCDGYQRQTIFVTHEPQTSSGAAGSTRVVAVRTPQAQLHRVTTLSAETISPLPTSLAQRAVDDQFIGLLWGIYLPKGNRLARGNQSSVLWADALTQMSARNDLLRLALRAISFSNSENESEKVVGTRAYGNALLTVNRLLQSPQGLTDEGVIPTCILLSFYEQFNGFGAPTANSQAANWQAHVSGLASLYQMRGPDQLAQGPARLFFCMDRMSQLAHAISRRKASPFQQQVWRTVPWNSALKTNKDKLYDIFLQVPTILQKDDLLKNARSASGQPLTRDECAELVHDIIRVHLLLEQWKAATPTMIAADQDEDDFSTIFAYDYEAAHTAVMYWTACIILYTILRVLQITTPSVSFSEFDLDLSPGGPFDPQPHAMHIVRSMEYFVHPDSGMLGFREISFPTGVALSYFSAFYPEEPRERKALSNSLFNATSAKPYGPLMGAFLTQMARTAGSQQSRQRGGPFGYSEQRSTAKCWFRLQAPPDEEPDISRPDNVEGYEQVRTMGCERRGPF